MNILILTPDRVGSTLLQRLITVYANINQTNNITVNLHELTNGIVSNPTSHGSMLGKKTGAWGYHQSLQQITELLDSVDHGITSRLAYYHIKNRKDSLKDQLSFYEYLNKNFFIISARRHNLFEYAVSWGISVESKKLNVYSFDEKYEIFKDIYSKGMDIDKLTLEKYLNQYNEYTHWVDAHFNVNAYFNYEEHLSEIERFILNLNCFKQKNYTNTWQQQFGIGWNDWNKMHYLLSLVSFGQEFTSEEKEFMKSNIDLYSRTRTYLQDMQDSGLLVSGIPIKLHTLAEKAKVVHNLEYCLDVYNSWIVNQSPQYAVAYNHNDITQIAQIENSNWKFGNIDNSSLLAYNDIDAMTLNKSDLKQ